MKKTKKDKIEKNQKGYIALLAVLILSGVALVLATTFAQVSVGGNQSSRSQIVGEDALALAESCAEEALMQVQINASYAGPTVTVPEGSCSVSVNNALGIWSLQITTTSVTQASRTLSVFFTRGSQISILSWLEL